MITRTDPMISQCLATGDALTSSDGSVTVTHTMKTNSLPLLTTSQRFGMA